MGVFFCLCFFFFGGGGGGGGRGIRERGERRGFISQLKTPQHVSTSPDAKRLHSMRVTML